MRAEAPPAPKKAKRKPEANRSSWSPVDLGPILAGKYNVEAPSLLVRTDGEALVYRRRLHSVSSEPEGGKGWFTLHIAAEVIGAGENVLMLDFEVEAAEAVDRLRALGVDDEAIGKHLLYVRPDEPLTDSGWKALESIVSKPLALVILDGVTEAMTLDGLNPLDNFDVAKWQILPKRIMDRTGAAVVLVDHVTKDKEGRGRWSIGAQHKMAGISVAYTLTVVEPFGRGKDGEVTINVEKDRPGHVRRLAEDKTVATMRLLSEDDGQRVRVEIEPPAERGEFRPTVLMERLSEQIEAEPGIGKRELRNAVNGNNNAKEFALRLLIAEDYVSVTREGQKVAHHPVTLYRAAQDPVLAGASNG